MLSLPSPAKIFRSLSYICEEEFSPAIAECSSYLLNPLLGHIGKLVRIEGIVIRATPVKPSITVATYACDTCGTEVYQEVTGPSFMPRFACDSEICVVNRVKGQLSLLTRGSKFQKFQELKIQEMSHHVPTGHIPRTMTIHAYGPTTRQAAPGDHVHVTGIFLPTPSTGGVPSNASGLTIRYLPRGTEY